VPISDRKTVRIKGMSQGYPGPNDLDIAVCKIKIRSGNSPFLLVSETGAVIHDEVVMCGYPGSNESLSIRNGSNGLRFSPIAQVGRIGGLLPADGVDRPYATQTDIVGTNGSSGSPIVSLFDGQVVGVATDIITTQLTTELDHTGDMMITLSNV
jgi:S1-C subfamily serine protease